MKEAKNATDESKACKARMWRLFPHLMLCLSLVFYAVLGALLFQYIEGGSTSPTKVEYHDFLGHIIRRVQNLTNNASYTHRNIVEELEHTMQDQFKTTWLQLPEKWTFAGSLFFCCTVFTTVGYGHIYPVTLSGKVACVLYAMVGIPLMLLVILDVGDFLAMLMYRAYVSIHAFFKVLCSHTWPSLRARMKASDSSQWTVEDGVTVFSRDVVVRELLDMRQVLQSQVDVKHNSMQLQNNKEIFEKILARENLLRKSPLLRSLSCPELNRLPPLPTGFAIWDFTGLGDSMEQLKVPFVLILFIVFAYILLGGLIMPMWEKEFTGFDPYYFCFITLTTIGFGDLVPHHPKYFMLTSLFIIAGMAIMSMAFKLSQTRIVSCYRKCIKIIGKGNDETTTK
ncbi:potassium channel subfamily K member 18 [Dunckerocampus dactyliophorus]|uniref:potassium channel subfamily K member 18 n=1 Tax=Dunckerocampus dactyliophorus TaxID=161453 RepID=UPI00240754C0|nr:potassium channel subfamily K member 18 [Dunckerocampus dactyliophorus]